MKKVIFIERVNNNAQESAEQREVMRQWLNSLDYQSDEIECLNCAASADTFEEIKRLVNDGSIKAVAAWDIASLGRSESDLLKLKMFLIEHKVQLLVKEPAIKLLNDDGTVSMGANMLFSVCAAMVETNLSKL